MKQINDQLNMSITNTYQIDSHNRQPTQYVYVHNRQYGQPNDIFKVKMGRLPGVMSINVEKNTEDNTFSFTIVVQNKDGLLSPDYHYGKTPINLALRGHLDSPWRGQLKPNTKIEIHWGFGEYVVRDLTGLIDDVKIDAATQTLTIRGRSMRKLVVDNTISPYPGYSLLLPKETMRVQDAINRLVVYAGLTIKMKPVLDPETGEDYLINEAMGRRGEQYYEILKPLVNSVFHTIVEDEHGHLELIDKPRFSQEEKAVYTIDDAVNITDLDYSNTDTEIFGTVLVETHNNLVDSFSSKYTSSVILNGYRREKRVIYPWATSQKKRELAAASEFTDMLHNFRTITVTILANPALDLWDTVRIQERISTAQWNYHIKGIQTTFDSNGFTQRLKCSSNFEFKEYAGSITDLPPNTTPEVTTQLQKVRVGVWENGAKDYDVINILLNGQVIASNVVLDDGPQYFDVELKQVGYHTLKFVGVSAGRSGVLGFHYAIQDDNNMPLVPTGEISFSRSGSNEYGYYTSQRPERSVVIHKNG